jgi:hypothetical protein
VWVKAPDDTQARKPKSRPLGRLVSRKHTGHIMINSRIAKMHEGTLLIGGDPIVGEDGWPITGIIWRLGPKQKSTGKRCVKSVNKDVWEPNGGQSSWTVSDISSRKKKWLRQMTETEIQNDKTLSAHQKLNGLETLKKNNKILPMI